MKTTIKVTELNHEELVNILSGATYGNSLVGIEVAEDSKELAKKLRADETINTDCIEDVWAEVLLNGGNITIIDVESDARDEEDAIKHAYKGCANKVGFRIEEGWCGEYGVTLYDINLKGFLEGCSNANAFNYLKDTLDGEGDMWTAYNLLQIITFGEEIYG